MENRSPYVMIGAAVLVFAAAVAGFLMWKLRAGDGTQYAYYDIHFGGDVQGLTADSPVFYRGIRVGRVHAIALASRREVRQRDGREREVEKIRVTVAVDRKIDIREKSYAVFERPFIAGSAYIQIAGRLEVDEIKPKNRLGEKPYPEIRTGSSFIQETSMSAQELLSKISGAVDRLNAVLSDDNVKAFSDLMANLARVSDAVAGQSANIEKLLSELPAAVGDVRDTVRTAGGAVQDIRTAVGDLRGAIQGADKVFASANLLVAELGPQDAEARALLAGRTPGELGRTLAQARQAMASLDAAAANMGRLVADNRRPIAQFTESGLTEFSLAIRELRQLTANLNVIATKLERDPAGFVLGGKQGYTPR